MSNIVRNVLILGLATVALAGIALAAATTVSQQRQDVNSLSSVNGAEAQSLSIQTQEERFRKLSQFVFPYDFEVHEKNAIKTTADKDNYFFCRQLLRSIKSLKKSDILTPIYTAENTQNLSNKSHLDLNLKSCGKKYSENLYREYFPSEVSWRLAEPDSFYYEATKNFELYNLTSFFSNDVWALWAEGARPHCQSEDAEICKSAKGGRSLGNIFSPSSCEIYAEPSLAGLVSRSIPRIFLNEDGFKSVRDSEVLTNNFFAYVSINHRPYRVLYRTDLLPNDSCLTDVSDCAMSEDGTFLWVSEIHSRSEKKPFACVYNPIIP